MRWWFSASNRDVKIVILAKYDHRRRCIRLERTSDDASVIAGYVTQTSQIADETSISQITVKTANKIYLESVTIRPRTLLVATCVFQGGVNDEKNPANFGVLLNV
ncbi:hypothetical protein P885DRAFT_64556 [Corynascus similis CBS 632.67]